MSSNTVVFFDISIDRSYAGRIEMTLRDDVVPKTVRNFVELCQRVEGKGFKNCPFHRIIPSFMIQGGDFTKQDGTGGESIYGEFFEDENFILQHEGPGTLSMANCGPDTNGSQFFICTTPTPFLDGKHVVFGKVTKGLEIVKAMEACGSRNGDTSSLVKIDDCGVVETQKGNKLRISLQKTMERVSMEVYDTDTLWDFCVRIHEEGHALPPPLIRFNIAGMSIKDPQEKAQTFKDLDVFDNDTATIVLDKTPFLYFQDGSTGDYLQLRYPASGPVNFDDILSDVQNLMQMEVSLYVGSVDLSGFDVIDFNQLEDDGQEFPSFLCIVGKNFGDSPEKELEVLKETVEGLYREIDSEENRERAMKEQIVELQESIAALAKNKIEMVMRLNAEMESVRSMIQPRSQNDWRDIDAELAQVTPQGPGRTNTFS